MVTNDIQLIDERGKDWGQGTIRKKPFIDAYNVHYEIVHPFKLSQVTAYFNASNDDKDAVSTSCVYCNLVLWGRQWEYYLL